MGRGRGGVLCVALSALGTSFCAYLGLRPRLLYFAPLALKGLLTQLTPWAAPPLMDSKSCVALKSRPIREEDTGCEGDQIRAERCSDYAELG